MFYEEWSPVLESSDPTSTISPIMIGEIETTTLLSLKSTITIDDLELFGNLSFTHHVRILNGVKDVNKRWKYIRLSLENKWDTRYLQQQIKDYAKPMGVATYRFREDMPEKLREALPDAEDLKKLL